jgi:hypothetical protein
MSNDALMVRARTEHRLGEVLAETVKARGRNSSGNSVLPEGISKIQSSRAQQLARIPERDTARCIPMKTSDLTTFVPEVRALVRMQGGNPDNLRY